MPLSATHPNLTESDNHFELKVVETRAVRLGVDILCNE